MNNFVFYNPTKILFGEGMISKIGKEISDFTIDKVLLLAGGGSIKQNGVYEQTIDSLKKNNIDWIEFWGVRANPSLEHARQARKIIEDNDIQAILAVGGGSVIDEAKALAASVNFEDVWNPFELREPITEALPIFTILTISATGSEMDAFAVLSNDEEKKKWNIGGPALFPIVSIIDPKAQVSLPWNQTVNGAIDALSHIMEFHFIATDEEATIAINEALMNTIIKCVDALKIDETNYSARANLAWCATLALNGLSGVAMKGGDWTSHALEHALSAYNVEIAHGAGLAVVLPAWLQFVSQANPKQFARWAKNVWNADTIEGGIANIKAKYKEWGAPISLGELGFAQEDIPALAQNALGRGALGAVLKLSQGDIEKIYELAL